MNVLRFAGPFAFLAAVPISYDWSSSAAFTVPVAILLSLLITSYLPEPEFTESDLARLLPVLYTPLHLIVIAWAICEVSGDRTNVTAFASLASAVGICTGVFGVLAAHEMVHSRVRWQHWLGAAMLTGMSYRHFRISHIYGHHRHAATERDCSTARLGESFYAFFVRTLRGQFTEAWRFETSRLRNASLPRVRNRLNQDVTIMLLIYALLWWGMGWRAAAFLACESVIAILVLELFNYVAHYGLLRRTNEWIADHHSWNSSGAANLLIFNMGRHSHHHRAPTLAYDGLRKAPYAAELPAGYAGAILLALIPPLWRAVIHPRLDNLAAPGRESVYADGSRPAAAIP
ncbi:MAG TPA: alkane 1-monooxygenase [Rhizomicrobium sp.]|jgi:alkane 1-monooxygenase|nr:alkane 1-monooxygenase [Rhizomicrobium sp.]